MRLYALQQQEHSAALFAVLISLFATILVYGLGPFLFYKLRRTEVKPSRFGLFCAGYTAAVYLLLRISGWTTSGSASPALFWGLLFHEIFRRKISQKKDKFLGQEADVGINPVSMPEEAYHKKRNWGLAILVVALTFCVAAEGYMLISQGNYIKEQEAKIADLSSDLDSSYKEINRLNASSSLDGAVLRSSERYNIYLEKRLLATGAVTADHLTLVKWELEVSEPGRTAKLLQETWEKKHPDW